MKIAIKLVCSLAVGLLCLAAGAQAAPINTDKAGVAVKGFDTVAYFTVGKPVPGKMEFQHTWNNAKWHFANSEHLELFKADPEKYAPQYGGY